MEFLQDPHAILESVIIAGFVTMATIGFFAGLKALFLDLRNLRRAKV